MQLRYISTEGKKVIVPLGQEPLTLGRSDKASVVIADDDISRLHASIRVWDNDYVIKDLGSQNGTLVNDKMADIAILKPGDKIRLGSCDIFFEEKEPKGPNTVIRKVSAEMASSGKGYRTIMMEVVKETEKKKPAPDKSQK